MVGASSPVLHGGHGKVLFLYNQFYNMNFTNEKVLYVFSLKKKRFNKFLKKKKKVLYICNYNAEP